MLAEVRRAARDGVPVVVASRCPQGSTAIKLMVLLGAGADAARIREAFLGSV